MVDLTWLKQLPFFYDYTKGSNLLINRDAFSQSLKKVIVIVLFVVINLSDSLLKLLY